MTFYMLIITGIILVLVLMCMNQSSINQKYAKVEGFENPNNDELVLYYAPWCGETVAFIPEWNRMKDLIKESGLNIPTREVDCEPTDANGKASLNSICDVEKIEGYPTIKKVKADGSSSKEFVGLRKAEEITRFFQETPL